MLDYAQNSKKQLIRKNYVHGLKNHVIFSQSEHTNRFE